VENKLVNIMIPWIHDEKVTANLLSGGESTGYSLLGYIHSIASGILNMSNMAQKPAINNAFSAKNIYNQKNCGSIFQIYYVLQFFIMGKVA
jgi:hypothetical protein